MKLKNFLGMMAIALCVVACSDDDNNDQSVNLAREVAGTYNGYTSAKFSYSPNPTVTPKEKVVIADKGDSKVDLTLASTTWGEFKLTDVAVKKDGNAYKMEGTGKASLQMSGHASGEYDFTLTGSVEQGKKNSSFVVSLTIMGGTTITFIEGDAPVNQIVAGSYTGTTVLFVSGKEQGSEENKNVAVTSEDDGTVKIVLPAFAEGEGMSLPEITLTAVKVETSDYVTYSILEAPIDITLNNTNYTGKLTGKVVAGKLSLSYTCTPAAMAGMGMTISAEFTTAAK